MNIGKTSCRKGGNHHHWIMGACLDCGKSRRQFMDEFRERQRRLKSSTLIGRRHGKIGF
jgi:hypothetical protein